MRIRGESSNVGQGEQQTLSTAMTARVVFASRSQLFRIFFFFSSPRALCQQPWFVKQVLYSEEALAGKVRELAARIDRDYADAKQPIVCVGILKGKQSCRY